MFSQFMMIQQSRQGGIRDIVEYELGPVLWALAKPNGEMWSTPKSKIIKDIEKDIPLTTSLSEILPEFLILWSWYNNYLKDSTHPEMYLTIFWTESPRMHLVVYSLWVISMIKPQSIKSLERKTRSCSGQTRTNRRRREQKVPVNFEKFVNNSENKLELRDSFVSDWSSTLHCAECVGDKEIFGCKIFCRNNIPSCVVAPEICSDQEEAHTKMFLCVAFALTLGFSSFCIVTIDTDILILDCCFSNKLEGNLFIKLLTKPKRIFDFTHHLLDANYCHALPGYHAVTCCDYTSSFHGLGKTKGLKHLNDNLSFQVRVHCLYAKIEYFDFWISIDKI